MARKRRTRQGDADVLSSPRWSQLREQERLQAANHSQQANEEARKRTQELLSGGYGSIDWDDMLALYSEK